MRRLRILNGPLDYAKDLAASASRGWNAFFFSPADPTPLGLIRIATGALLAWSLAILGLDLRAFLGSDGWADPFVVRSFLADRGSYGWSFWLAVPDALLWPAWGLCLVVLLMFAAGLFSRVTAPLAWVIAVSTAQRVPVMLFGFDQVIAFWALYCAVTGASGQALSLDRWRGGRSGPPLPTVPANLSLRLIQLQLCVIYGMAGLAKLQGAAWWNGTAFGMVLLTREFRSMIDVSWLVRYPWAVNLATHVTIAFELLYPALIWNRLARPILIALAVLLHLGIGLTLGLNEFGLAMIAANLAFLRLDWLREGAFGGTKADDPARRAVNRGPRSGSPGPRGPAGRTAT
ncbi:MAG: HTTM domain-containing protein [Isosphaeraceae bacterium]